MKNEIIIKPIDKVLTIARKKKLKSLEQVILDNIIGQDHIIEKVVETLERGELDLNLDKKRPLTKGSFLFLGPTGVGKTELTLTFTEHLFGENSLHRFDMSEFMHFDSVKQLIGDETGSCGRLGVVLENNKGGTLLFDEIEKGHTSIMDLFLQILDAARITLGNGKTYGLENYYIVFTSNIGANRIPTTGTIMSTTLERGIRAELFKNMRKEIVARMGVVLIFKQLGFDIQKVIAAALFDKELRRMKLRGCELTYDSKAFNFIIRNGIQEGLGVRPLRDTIFREVGNAIAEVMLRGNGKPNGILTAEGGKLIILQDEHNENKLAK